MGRVTRAVLLPSPFLPANAYAPLVDALGRRAWGVVMATTSVPPAEPEPVLTAYRLCVEREHPDFVVCHSNAGRYAVAVAGGVPVVHVDAALPPESGEVALAPEALLDHLTGLADEASLLPPWTRWWDDDDVATVVPDPTVLAAIRAEERRMPLAYFRAPASGPPTAGSPTRRRTSPSGTPTPRRPPWRGGSAGQRRCWAGHCTCTTLWTRMPWPTPSSTSPWRSAGRSGALLVPGRRPRRDRAGTATPSSASRSVRSE